MKRVFRILISVLLIASLFTGCAKSKDSAASNAANSGQSSGSSDTASAFYNAYVERKTAVVSKIMDGLGNNPETTMSAFSFLGAAFSDLYLLPAAYFGLGETSVATALAMTDAKDVVYEENGNTYTITYRSSEGTKTVLTGTYNPGKSLVCVGSADGKENIFSEAYQTSFGYVGQFYMISADGTSTLYLYSISGEDGSIGIVSGGERPAGLTGSESADFTTSAKEWYAIQGSTITGVTADGKSVSFEYVPSESND